MSLVRWMEKYIVPLPEAVTSDLKALEAYLSQLRGISELETATQMARAALRTTSDVWFRCGRNPRMVDSLINTFHFNRATCPLCIRHPDCETKRDCPLNAVNHKQYCCFEPLNWEDADFPSPWKDLQQGNPDDMILLVIKALKKTRGAKE